MREFSEERKPTSSLPSCSQNAQQLVYDSSSLKRLPTPRPPINFSPNTDRMIEDMVRKGRDSVYANRFAAGEEEPGYVFYLLGYAFSHVFFFTQ